MGGDREGHPGGGTRCLRRPFRRGSEASYTKKEIINSVVPAKKKLDISEIVKRGQKKGGMVGISRTRPKNHYSERYSLLEKMKATYTVKERKKKKRCKIGGKGGKARFNLSDGYRLQH